MALTTSQQSLLTHLESMPQASLSRENRRLLLNLQRTRDLGRFESPTDKDGGPIRSSLQRMIEIGSKEGGTSIAVGPDAQRQAVIPQQQCRRCKTLVSPKSGIDVRIYRCPNCRFKWSTPVASRIAQIDPNDPRNQPRTPAAPFSPPAEPMLLVGSQPFRLFSFDPRDPQ